MKKLNVKAIKILVFAIILVVLLMGVAIQLKDRWSEMGFAFKHPNMVRELRQLYEMEHEDADYRILLRQRMEIEEAEEVVEEEVKE